MNREAKFLDQVAAFLGRPNTMPVGEYAAVEDRIAAMARRAGLTFDAQVAILRGTLDAMRDLSRDVAALDGARGGRPAVSRIDVIVQWSELAGLGVDRRKRTAIIARRLGMDASQVRSALAAARKRGDLRPD